MPYPIAPVPAARTTASAPAVKIVLVIAESPLSVSASSDCRRAVRRDRRGWRRPPALSWVAPATPFRERTGCSVDRISRPIPAGGRCGNKAAKRSRTPYSPRGSPTCHGVLLNLHEGNYHTVGGRSAGGARANQATSAEPLGLCPSASAAGCGLLHRGHEVRAVGAVVPCGVARGALLLAGIGDRRAGL